MKIGMRYVGLLLLLATWVSTGAGKEGKDEARLIAALNDENVGRRVSAIQLLGERQVEAAVDPLIEVLLKDAEYSARFSAAVALVKIGDVKALPALERAARRDRSKTVRHIAEVAYEKIKRESEMAKASKSL